MTNHPRLDFYASKGKIRASPETPCNIVDVALGVNAPGKIMTSQNLKVLSMESDTVRDQADALLAKLIKDRAMCEKRLAENGKADPIKVVTGQSAIDKAIDETRAVIRNVDKLQSHASDPVPQITIHVFDNMNRSTQPV